MAEPVRFKANDPILGLPGEIKPLRIVLYVFLLLSAVSALFLEPALAGAVKRGAVSRFWMYLPAILYGVFFAIYAIDRWFLVRRRAYPAGRAFFQIAFGIVFGLLLLPSSDWRETRPVGTARLLSHPDPEVRLVAVEAVGCRVMDPKEVPTLLRRLDDRDPRVAEAARTVLSRWSGKDPADEGGIRAWASGLSATTSTRTEGGD